LTGAASHRENGGATEISIRGMGPYLGSTVINGREATNGSGDRSVNFSQFPSELFNKLGIYKTQAASFIEGGVAGQIALETIKPLDHGKRSITLQGKAAYNPDEQNLDNNVRDVGYRGTASYIDQFETESGQKFGISLGVQRNETTNPEQEAITSGTPRLCGLDPATGQTLTSGNCNSGNGVIDLSTPEGRLSPFIATTSSRTFRQNTTGDERESLFAAFQWQPNDRLDINIDAQVSEREATEQRRDLTFAEARRGIENLISDNGIVRSYTNAGRIETLSTDWSRTEEYEGLGFNAEYQVNDKLSVAFDASHSNTRRSEKDVEVRLRSNNDFRSDRVPTAFNIYPGGGLAPNITVTNFDATDHSQFRNSTRIRPRERVRDNTVSAMALDFDFQTDSGFISSWEGGLRASELEYQTFGGRRPTASVTGDVRDANAACRTPFPESGFLSSQTRGPLITNVDEAGNVIAAGTGNSFASFDAQCLVRELTGAEINPDDTAVSLSSVDVTEETLAAYLQANYEGQWGDKPIRGNFGLRVVDTEVDSIGYRSALTTVTDPQTGEISFQSAAGLDTVNGGGSYTEVLPSASLVMDLDDDLLFRAGVFRGLSRPDPSSLGFARNFTVQDGDSISDVADLLQNVRASGNPNTEPLLSWNVDTALEWYPNEDTILAGGLYYKSFQGGFKSLKQAEAFDIDGNIVNGNVTTTVTDDDTSKLYGLELTATHSFSYLPGFWSGFGTKVSYNYASSDFEFEDGAFGSSTVLDEAGNIVSQQFGILPPTEIFGLSKNVASVQLYYQTENFDAQLIYKTRSEYFQQFISSPTRIRLVDDNEVWELRMSYQLNDRVKLTAEGINLFDEPRRDFRYQSGNQSAANIKLRRMIFRKRTSES